MWSTYLKSFDSAIKRPVACPSSFSSLYGIGGRETFPLSENTSLGCTMSAIVGQFELRTALTIPQFWADYVAREHGIASLMGKTKGEGGTYRGSTPDFRVDLKKEAQRLFYPL